MDTSLKSKHTVSVPILKSVDIDKPLDWHAILMPGYTGPEASLLYHRGVPKQNLLCIERSRKPWEFLKKQGVLVTPTPMDAYEAVHWLIGRNFDPKLIYLDFMSQIGLDEYKTVSEIIKWFIGKDVKLMLTFGMNRTTREKAAFSRLFGHGWSMPYPPVVPFLDDIIHMGRFREYRKIKEHPYVSGKWHYVTVEADF